MVKDKRWVKESNISQESINLRDFLLMEKEVVMEFLFQKKMEYMQGNGKMA